MRGRGRLGASPLRLGCLAVASIALVAALAPRGDAGPPGEALWARVLQDRVRDGAVDYDALARDPTLLQAFVAWLAVPLPATASHQDSVAFYINAYNACAIDLIVRDAKERHGHPRGIRSISGAWTLYRWDVGGVNRTLDEMENVVLRGRLREPRAHFALACASRSCPALRPTPYVGAFVDAELDSAGREFALDPRRNQLAPGRDGIRVSRIFDWYGKDFVGAYRDSALEREYGRVNGAVLACVIRYLPEETASELRAGPVKFGYLPYDWSLNTTANR